MPYLKSKDIRGTPLCSLKYICNPKKTDDGTLVSAVNCMSEPKNAYEEMKRVYEFCSGRSFNEPVPEKGKAKVKLIHYIQSFDPQDNVTPEFAQRIAQATVSDMFGSDVQAVIATHTDTGKIHNHIIINVYDINGKRFHSNQTTLKKMKWISDVACMRHGIEPYDKTRKPKPKITAYNEWEHKKKGTSWKQQIRDRLDELVSTAVNLDELLKTLEQLGYEIKRGKYISIRAPEQERFVRTKTLGDDYTEENLVKRISENSVIRVSASTKQFHDSYYGVYVSLFNKSGAYCGAKPVMTMCDFYYGQYETVVRERLNSIGKVRDKLATAQAVLDTAQEEMDAVSEEKSETQDIVKSALRYFNVMKGVQKIFPKTEADKAAVSTVKQYGLKSVEDVEQLKQTVTEKNTELASLKEKLVAVTTEMQK